MKNETIKKSFFRHWQLILNFFTVHLPILVRCKTKGTVGALCALLHNWQLSALLPTTITERDDPVTLKDSHRMGDRRIFFLKNSTSPLFKEGLSNEHNFGRIHLAGQYLKSCSKIITAHCNFIFRLDGDGSSEIFLKGKLR